MSLLTHGKNFNEVEIQGEETFSFSFSKSILFLINRVNNGYLENGDE